MEAEIFLGDRQKRRVHRIDEAEIVEHVFEYNKNSYEDIREMEKMCTNVAGANNDEGDDSTKHPLDAEFHPWQFEKYEHAYA